MGHSRDRGRRLLLRLGLGFTLGFLVPLSVPTIAAATTVSFTNGVVTFQASAGQSNGLIVEFTRDYGDGPGPVLPGTPILSLVDAPNHTGVPITAGEGCEQAGNGVFCPFYGVDRVVVNAGDGNDSVTIRDSSINGPIYDPPYGTVPVTVNGGSGHDTIGLDDRGAVDEAWFGYHPATIDGGPDRDTIKGSEADDVIDIADGSVDDLVGCLDGDDKVTADKEDPVPRDCEETTNGGPERPDGATGISINNGATYTNDPQVEISVRWPRLASQTYLSNDGGFANAPLLPVAATLPWMLASSGPERLPKTVYARFVGGDAGAETYQDDIILDETPPQINSATFDAPGGEPGAGRRPGKVSLRIKAKDKTSGIGGVQVTSNKRKPGKVKKFKSKISVPSGSKIYVRVLDKAENKSRWRRAKPR